MEPRQITTREEAIKVIVSQWSGKRHVLTREHKARELTQQPSEVVFEMAKRVLAIRDARAQRRLARKAKP